MGFLRASWDLLRQRCPRCRAAPIYERASEMHARCPACGLIYEPEPGYFVGSMYISYGMAVIFLSLTMLALHLLLPTWDLGTVALLSIAVFVPFVPAATRYARVVWLYFDHWAWPQETR